MRKWTVADKTAVLALLISIGMGIFNYTQSQRAIDISEKSLTSQGPNIAIAEEMLKEKSPIEYMFNIPIKNVGQRTASDLNVNFCFFGVFKNGFVTFHRADQPSNDLAPSVIQYASGSLIINPERHFPEVQYVVLNVSYKDDLLNQSISRNWFYGRNEFRPNEYSELIDSQTKKALEEVLPSCK